MEKRQVFKEGISAGIPIALGYFAVSFTFGMMAVNRGLSIMESVIISLTNLTSAGQFAALDIICSSGSYLELVLSELIINLRYCLMSFSLSQKLRKDEPFIHRFGIGFGVTDEIYAVSVLTRGKTSVFFNYGAMAVAIPGWVLGTLCGAVLGDILPDFLVSALSVAIYGMFIAIVIPPCKTNKVLAVVVFMAMLMSSAFAYLPLLKKVSGGFAIIITTVTVSALAALLCPIKEEDDE